MANRTIVVNYKVNIMFHGYKHCYFYNRQEEGEIYFRADTIIIIHENYAHENLVHFQIKFLR